ncbi:hypothetical protein KJK34_07260 [Flavobacterium sp. D11R37]|uniref:Arm DNA-binding domain-containing protein n=1 Tax=Flavobacterium coralii TaxID=2838017 RepID=UPI001CA6CDED|nr:Arm DNA-binding domain-containing protein [Flavobacterium coralii]MBY8962548.1 hypothetical protein [Flavobacterium coralii]
MKDNKLTILFLIERNKVNNKGTCPIKCRLTLQNKRKEFATGQFINSDYWNSKKQKALPSSEENNFINTQLSLISQKINKAFLMLQVQEMEFDVDDIYLLYTGESTKKNKSFLELLEWHNTKMEKLVGIEYAPRYYQKWKGMHLLMKDFNKINFYKTKFGGKHWFIHKWLSILIIV